MFAAGAGVARSTVINLVGDGEPLGVSCALDQPMLGNVQVGR